MCIRIYGIDRQGPARVFDRLLKLILLSKDNAEIIQRRRVTGIKLNRLFQIGTGKIKVPELEARRSSQIEDVWNPGTSIQIRQITLKRLGNTPRLMMTNRGLQ